ncbi:HD domain-containing phosphohydrolase [Tissierella sp.]|uniref:HD-GYP domain-containing protein n=1 Tax=Tissierella sp. TaxID=41274 RepID=UPI0030DADBA8
MLSPIDLLQTDNRGIDVFHCFRVAELAFKLCSQLEISNEEKEEIVLSAAMHDIGKSKIDISILNKPGKLNNKEWNEIKLHPKYGAAITQMMGYSVNISQNILYHHENSDGTGYPKGLKDEDILLGAAIIRICDSYDAMRSIRPYNRIMTHTEALQELIKDKRVYREDILDEFIKLDLNMFQKYY